MNLTSAAELISKTKTCIQLLKHDAVSVTSNVCKLLCILYLHTILENTHFKKFEIYSCILICFVSKISTTI